jgi:amino acid transporter/mannitol/fructose-specific phosphotransferase system IIA component (Ntr-type)
MKLKKSLSTLDLFCVATGAMISSGLFILPGLAFARAGPSVILSYLLAAILCIPTLMSKAELTTAMPKAGGDYFYIMRGFGPLLGTIAGFSAWFSLSLKGAFALLGMSAYLSIVSSIPLNIIAFWLCIFFVFLNLIGIKEAGRLQVGLVIFLLGILLAYIVFGSSAINVKNFSPFLPKGMMGVISTASFVFISYGGLTKVVALAEEVRDPGRSIPLAAMLSLLVTSIVYALVIFVTIGVMQPESLRSTITPISDAAFVFAGSPFKILIGIAAFLAFISTANSAIMTASRYPLGMSRDKLFPDIFQKISSRFGTPYISIIFTGIFMICAVLFLKLDILVKIASSILILLFISANATLILFRESKLLSYRPKFYSPFYPYLQVLGIMGGILLLIEMGTLIIFLTGIFIFLAILWYKNYVQDKVNRDSALVYLLEKLVAKDKELTSDNILVELKDIVLERDGMLKDEFHRLIEEAEVLDMGGPHEMEYFFFKISDVLGKKLNIDPQYLTNEFIRREKASSTVISKGLAIPHIVIEGKNVFKILLVRSKIGIIFPNDKVIHIIFVLVGSSDVRNLHLRALSAIAQITQEPSFYDKWFKATSRDELKNIILLAQRIRF